MNDFLSGQWNNRPQGVFPPQDGRYPPTHRSGDRLRYRMKGRTQKEKKTQDTMYMTNADNITSKLNATQKRRDAEAAERKRLRAEREYQDKIRKGILKEGQPLVPKMKTRREKKEIDYENVDNFPGGRPHCCLYMTSYPPVVANEDFLAASGPHM